MLELSNQPLMDFLFTSYFYPLSKPLKLSNRLKFSLDNPRTVEEVNYVKNVLVSWQRSEHNRSLPVRSSEDILTFERILVEVRDALSDHDSYVKEFLTSFRRKGILNSFARMWVIARFDQEGSEPESHSKQKQVFDSEVPDFRPLEFENPYETRIRRLVNYSHLLALISHSEGELYFGRKFILDPYPLHGRDIFNELTMPVVWLPFAARDFRLHPNKRGELDWIFWPFAADVLEKNAQLIEAAVEHGLAEKLLYVGELLRIANDVFDEKVRLLMLTSIIELLLTHNPDTGRFNVEDSINRQFQLKAALLVYLNDKKRNPDQVKKRLRTIYQQRSNVAHGNFGAVHDFITKLKKKEGEEEHFEDLISDLYTYIRAIMEEYLKDHRLIEFLKSS